MVIKDTLTMLLRLLCLFFGRWVRTSAPYVTAVTGQCVVAWKLRDSVPEQSTRNCSSAVEDSLLSSVNFMSTTRDSMSSYCFRIQQSKAETGVLQLLRHWKSRRMLLAIAVV